MLNRKDLQPVRKTHYINPRYYQNEKTILLNPSKPFSRKRKPPKKPGLFKYILLVFLLFSAFIGYSAYAGGMEDEGWKIEMSEDSITIEKHGNIIHGDNIYLHLSKDDCNYASWISRIYTMAENDLEPLVSKFLPYKVQNYSDKSDYAYTTAQIIDVKPFLAGHRALVYFGYYPIHGYLEWFRGGNEYYFEIVNADDVLIDKEYGKYDQDIITIKPTDYFDIHVNAYYFKGFQTALINAQQKCKDLGVVARV